MYLDDQGHVQSTGLGAYSEDAKFLDFVQAFPGADLSELRRVAPAKLRHVREMLDGKRFFTINKVRQPLSEADVERLHRELAIWEEVSRRLG
jgi:hypothetical protein